MTNGGYIGELHDNWLETAGDRGQVITYCQNLSHLLIIHNKKGEGAMYLSVSFKETLSPDSSSSF